MSSTLIGDNTVKETMSRLYNLKDIKITPVDLHRGFSAPGMPQVGGRAESTGITKKTYQFFAIAGTDFPITAPAVCFGDSIAYSNADVKRL